MTSIHADFPFECFEDIFRHLSGKDLLKCTLVCPGWNNFIESTRSCMKKIKVMGTTFCLNCRPHNPLKEFLMNSKRQYECLHLKGSYSATNFGELRELLTARGRRWTHVYAESKEFETDSHFLEFLLIFQSSVEKLVLKCGNLEAKSDCQTDVRSLGLDFPKLKFLDVSSHCYLLYDKAFINCTKLESLLFGNLDVDVPSPVLIAIRNSLISSNGLKKLRIFGSVFQEDFSTEINFQLRELSIGGAGTENQHQNVNLFLKTQSASLEVLAIEDQPIDIEVMKIVLSMPRLKKLSLKSHNFELLGPAAEALPQNQSVTHLDIKDAPHDETTIKQFLKAFPKVQILEMVRISDETVGSIAESCKSLKHLFVRAYRARNIVASFPKLVELQCDSVCNGFEESFVLFLETQRDTCQFLFLTQLDDIELMKTVLSMSCLRGLSFGTVATYLLKHAAECLPKSHSITELRLIASEVEIEALLGAFPEVQTLEIPKLTNEVADVISETCKSLKHLYVHEFQAEKISNVEFYSNLSIFASKTVHGKPGSVSIRLFQKFCTNRQPDCQSDMRNNKKPKLY